MTQESYAQRTTQIKWEDWLPKLSFVDIIKKMVFVAFDILPKVLSDVLISRTRIVFNIYILSLYV